MRFERMQSARPARRFAHSGATYLYQFGCDTTLCRRERRQLRHAILPGTQTNGCVTIEVDAR